ETFHRQHPDIDEETFCEAQRFCVKQWLVQRDISLCNLPAFERAHMHFIGEVLQRAAELQAISMMTISTYQEAQSLADDIAAQAQDRAKEAETRAQSMRQAIETIKRLRIAIAYENQKESLKEREKDIIKQLKYINQVVHDHRYQANTAEDVTSFETQRRIFN